MGEFALPNKVHFDASVNVACEAVRQIANRMEMSSGFESLPVTYEKTPTYEMN